MRNKERMPIYFLIMIILLIVSISFVKFKYDQKNNKAIENREFALNKSKPLEKPAFRIIAYKIGPDDYKIGVENAKGIVKLLLNGKAFNSLKNSPYYITLSTANLKNGKYVLTAIDYTNNLRKNITATWSFIVNHEFITLRKFPYPYKAMLSITSDIDGTSLQEFKDYHRFLNTTAMTEYGKGLGLDVGDSFWMYDTYDLDSDAKKHVVRFSDEMSYWYGLNNKQIKDASDIIKYYKVGWIDSMHTYGDFSYAPPYLRSYFKRSYATTALEELRRQNIKVDVWIDHGNANNTQNFVLSNRVPYEQGDNPRSPYYHTDILLNYGIKFTWGPTTSTFGFNNVLYPRKLKDGHKIWVFPRYVTNGKKYIWDPQYIDEELKPANLQRLIYKHQYAIIAQHLGIGVNKMIFNAKAINALKYLQNEYLSGNILVARTSRLLKYDLAQQYIRYNIQRKNNILVIDITKIDDPLFGAYKPSLDDIRGITFYVNNPKDVELMLDSKPISPSLISYNNPDYTGEKSIGIKWFPRDTTDYTVN